MVPSAYARLEAFPLTTSGKVDRKALPRPDDSVVPEPSPAPVERPRNDAETRIASVWSGDPGPRLGRYRPGLLRAGGDVAPRRPGQVPARAGVRPGDPAPRLLREPHRPLHCSPGRGNGRPGRAHRRLAGAQAGRQASPLLRPRRSSSTRTSRTPSAGVQPVVGIHVPTRYRPGDSDSIRIEAIAERYLSRSASIQPQGPYHLAGFCFGGVVAYEIARQLERRASGSLQVAILDGGLPSGLPEAGAGPDPGSRPRRPSFLPCPSGTRQGSDRAASRPGWA